MPLETDDYGYNKYPCTCAGITMCDGCKEWILVTIPEREEC